MQLTIFFNKMKLVTTTVNESVFNCMMIIIERIYMFLKKKVASLLENKSSVKYDRVILIILYEI
jgi:hypothetical protein